MKERCIFDANDIDRMVRAFPIAEMDKEITQAAITSHDKQLAPEIRFYWIDRRKAFELARDVSEFCFFNDIPTNEKTDTKRDLGLFHEKRLQGLIRVTSELQHQVSGLNKALANHLKERQGKKVSEFTH